MQSLKKKKGKRPRKRRAIPQDDPEHFLPLPLVRVKIASRALRQATQSLSQMSLGSSDDLEFAKEIGRLETQDGSHRHSAMTLCEQGAVSLIAFVLYSDSDSSTREKLSHRSAPYLRFCSPGAWRFQRAWKALCGKCIDISCLLTYVLTSAGQIESDTAEKLVCYQVDPFNPSS